MVVRFDVNEHRLLSHLLFVNQETKQVLAKSLTPIMRHHVQEAQRSVIVGQTPADQFPVNPYPRRDILFEPFTDIVLRSEVLVAERL